MENPIRSSLGLVTAVVVLLSIMVSLSEACPKNCSCLHKYKRMTCRSLSKFPHPIPEYTEEIFLWNAAMDEIPTAAFDGLKNVTKISIYESEIKTIRGCAFRFLPSLKSLTIYDVRLNHIKPFAFHSLKNLRKLTLDNIKVDHIQPNAFYNISNVKSFLFHKIDVNVFDSYSVRKLSQIKSLQIIKSKIGILKSNAIFGLSSVTSFSMAHNRIKELQCRTLESLSMALPQSMVYRNVMDCACGLAWLLSHVKKPQKSVVLRSLLEYNSCKAQNRTISLEELKADDLTCGPHDKPVCLSSPPPDVAGPMCGQSPQENNPGQNSVYAESPLPDRSTGKTALGSTEINLVDALDRRPPVAEKGSELLNGVHTKTVRQTPKPILEFGSSPPIISASKSTTLSASTSPVASSSISTSSVNQASSVATYSVNLAARSSTPIVDLEANISTPGVNPATRVTTPGVNPEARVTKPSVNPSASVSIPGVDAEVSVSTPGADPEASVSTPRNNTASSVRTPNPNPAPGVSTPRNNLASSVRTPNPNPASGVSTSGINPASRPSIRSIIPVPKLSTSNNSLDYPTSDTKNTTAHPTTGLDDEINQPQGEGEADTDKTDKRNASSARDGIDSQPKRSVKDKNIQSGMNSGEITHVSMLFVSLNLCLAMTFM